MKILIELRQETNRVSATITGWIWEWGQITRAASIVTQKFMMQIDEARLPHMTWPLRLEYRITGEIERRMPPPRQR